jgi:hypothetical protein
MAARDLYINLRPSTTQGAFVQSTKNLTAYTFTKFFREEKVSLNIYFLTPTPSAGVGSPASIETGISAYDCRIGIGTPGGAILASTSLTWDTDHFEGVLNINTEQMNAALDAASSGEISSTLEVELGNGTDEATFQQAVTIRDEVLTADGGLPVDNTESLFADSLELALTDSNSVEWRRTANDIYGDVRRTPLGGIFEDTDGIYVRPFVDAPLLFAGLSVSLAGSGPPSYTATPSSQSDTEVVGGEVGKYYLARVKVVITAEQTGYTGGTQKLGDNTRFYRGGTPPAGNENRVTLGDGTSTYVLNWAASSNAALFTATYYADVVVASGVTLTLTINSVDGTMVGTSQSCAVTLEQAAEIPNLYTKLAALEALTWTNNTIPIFTGATTVSTVASSSFQAAGTSLLLTGGTLSGQINFSGTNHAGIRLVSLTTTERNALTAANGMLIYNTTTSTAQQYAGGAWSNVSGLTNWTDSGGTYSGVSYSKLTPSSGTNVGAVIQPLGTGAFQLQVADGTSAGGNNRGSYAIDLQTSRNNASEVASGEGAFVAGKNGTASGQQSVAFGAGIASGSTSFAMGGTASGTSSSAFGGSATATRSFAFGSGSLADCYGKFALTGFTSTGTAQTGLMTVRNTTANATPTELTADANAAASTTTNQLRNNSTFAFSIRVVARRTDADGENDAWEFRGLIHRNANAASTTLDVLRSDHLTETVAQPSGATSWTVAIDADTTLGAIRVTVTGESAKSISWVATIITTEVSE